MPNLLENLSAYFAASKVRIQQEPELLQLERSKMFLVNKKHSHKEEIAERLSFLQLFATHSDFQISKVELKAIYSILSQSAVNSDLQGFFEWCK